MSNNEEFVSISDFMSGLMMVFLFVSVVYIDRVNHEKKAIEQIAVTYKDTRDDLNSALIQEFRADLLPWNAEILADSTVRFHEPDVLFDLGSATIKPRFQEVLRDFFPRYVSVLGGKEFKDSIEELRIEGHTSSSWENSIDLVERYARNAHLSQERSFSILQYCFSIPAVVPYQEWLTKVLRANGLAFANPIMMNGQEDEQRSRRVEFKVKTKAEERIQSIVSTIRKSKTATP